MGYRPLSFTKNLGGLDNLHDVIRRAFVPGTTLEDFKNRVPTDLANRILVVEEFFIATKIIDDTEYVVEDALISASLTQTWNLTLARLYLFALVLNMPGPRRNKLYQSPAAAQNDYVRNVAYVGTGWRADKLTPTAMEPWVNTNVDITGGLRKFCTNFSYFFEQCHFARKPSGYLETEENSWGPLALRLFFDRVSIGQPTPTTDDLLAAARTREVHKLLGAPESWLDDVAEGAAVAYSQGRTELLAAPPSPRKAHKGGPAARVSAMMLRLQRCAANKKDLDKWYGSKCQICGNILAVRFGNGVDHAHIRPLGSPHSGDDDTNNMLALCPNHHRQLDRGAISIDPETRAILAPLGSFPTPLTTLTVHQNHNLSSAAIGYHRDNIFRR